MRKGRCRLSGLATGFWGFKIRWGNWHEHIRGRAPPENVGEGRPAAAEGEKMREGGTPSLACARVLFWLGGSRNERNYGLYRWEVERKRAWKCHAQLAAQQTRQLRNSRTFFTHISGLASCSCHVFAGIGGLQMVPSKGCDSQQRATPALSNHKTGIVI